MLGVSHRSCTAERCSAVAAAVLAALFVAITIRCAGFAAAISDVSGYVSEASRWLASDLFVPQPFAFWPDWQLHWNLPLGYRSGPLIGADVFTYPPGLPMAMAAAMAWGGELAAYLVPPVLGGLLVWASGELAARLAGPYARVIAAALMASSAIALLMAAQAMSDVPASAWWALALALAARGRPMASLAAGLCVSMAILTRPNLAPLAIVPAVLVVHAAQRRRVFVGGLFGIAALVGPVLLMWMQHVLYGSAWTFGHLGIENAFSLAHARTNRLTYVRWYAEAHTPAVVLAVLAPAILWRPRATNDSSTDVCPRVMAVALTVVIVGVYLAYLFYTPFDEWSFLRFMLPAFAPLYALTAAVLAHAVERGPSVARLPLCAVVLLLTAGLQSLKAYERGLATTPREFARVPVAGHYLEAMLPRNAIVITFFHSGSVRHYTGRPILRPDLIPREQLDMLSARLERGGYHPYLLIDDWLERGGFLSIFPSSRFGALDWPPRARIGSHGGIVLYDPRDRERHARGERWPIDVVR